MRKTSHKSQRINGEVQKELSRIIRMELKDPRINPMTSVTDVMVTQDLKYCKAYISIRRCRIWCRDVKGLRAGEWIYPPRAGAYDQSPKYTGAYVCIGHINRVWKLYV